MSDNVIVSIKDWRKITILVKESQETAKLMVSQIKEKDEIILGLQEIIEQLLDCSQDIINLKP